MEEAPCHAAQAAAEGEAQEAGVRCRGLEAQLGEQRRALAAQQADAGSLARDLAAEQAALDAVTQRWVTPWGCSFLRTTCRSCACCSD